MPYQVLARKWRPQRFDEVVGQVGVTRTLANAIANDRLAQAFIFAGARGVGKTTTARILARALNCVEGPRIDPCGRCDACVEIAEGRDLDVLEIDAATHTGIDNVRGVIIEDLAVRPVRDRYKVFIIDEVHQLSRHSFNALLKSIEEPPPHVVFVMATTELDKIPDTIKSRSQVYEFKTIPPGAIREQLRTIADAEGIDVEEAALAMLARAAEGSMRDAQSAFDQVLAFASGRITEDDVAAVLGLVARDLLLDIVEAVAADDAPTVLALAGRAAESGQDLKLVCRELSRVVRDIMVLKLDPSRAEDPDFAPGGEGDRLLSLAGRIGTEDVLRAFDLLSRAERDVRDAALPRYSLEMALLRWIHLQRLVPIEDVLRSLRTGGALPGPEAGPAPSSLPLRRTEAGGTASRLEARRVARLENAAAPAPDAAPPRSTSPTPLSAGPTEQPIAGPPSPVQGPAPPSDQARERLLDEIRRANRLFYGTVVAQARRISVDAEAVTFVFGPVHRTLRTSLVHRRSWLAGIAERALGRPLEIRAVEEAAEGGDEPAGAPEAVPDAKEALRAQALKDEAVQAMLDVFPAEIEDVEEIER